MTRLPFGRTARLVNTRSSERREFRIGLESIEKSTGRLIDVGDVEYEGDGVSFEPGDVLFGKLRPNLAKAWRADRSGDAVGDFHVYRPIPQRMTSRFLSYLVLSEPFLGPVVAAVQGAKMPRADWDVVRKVEVHSPELAEQRAIADYLDRETAQIDAFIAKNEEMVDLLAERRVALVTQAVEGAIARRDWVQVRHLATVLDCKHVTAELSESADARTIASVRQVGGRWVNTRDARRTTHESFANLVEGGRDLRAWDLLVCRNASVGKVSIVPEGIEPTAMGQDVSLIRTNQGDSASARYLFYTLVSAIGVDQFETASIGSTFRRINVDDIKAIRVPKRDPREAAAIADRLDAETEVIDKAIDAARHSVDLARERRAALVSAAVTGKIDVGVSA